MSPRDVVSIPIPTWRRWLCRIGFHDFGPWWARSTVIPTGNALLIKERHEIRGCCRYGCEKVETRGWKREEA